MNDTKPPHPASKTDPLSRNWVHELASCTHQDAYTRYTGKADAKYYKVDEPLTDDVIAAHLSGSQPIGVYILSEEQYGRCIVFDFDDHGGEFQSVMERVIEVFLNELEYGQIPHIAVRSGSGTGYHVWIVYENKKRCDALRKEASELLGHIKVPINGEHVILKPGTGGIGQGQVEVFPKGSSVGGSNVALPLARKSVRVMSKDLHIVETDADDLPLVKRKKPGPKTHKAKADRDAAFAALAKFLDPTDYDQWVRMAHLLIAAFSKGDDWARSRWIEWSSTADNADPEHKLEQKWDRHLAPEPRMSQASFWFAAKDAGFDGEMPFKQKDHDRFSVFENLRDIKIVRSPDNETFAEIALRDFVPVKSLALERYMRRKAFEESKTLSTEIVSQVVRTLDALDAEISDVHLRFASHGEKRYFYLGDDAATVIEIDKDGWRACDDPPVKFRRGDGRAIPMPVEGGLDEFRSFVNVDDENLPFYLAWVVSCFLRPGLAAPIAVLTGPPGSAKSTLLETTVNLIDPKPGAKAGMPTKEDDLVVSAQNGAVISFDNASTLAKLSDPLCRIATGGGVRKRTLYTDKEVSAIDVIHPVIVSGIDPTVWKSVV